MKLIPFYTLPFAGWAELESTIQALGPRAVLRALLQRAWTRFQHNNSNDPIHNMKNHEPAVRVALRVFLDNPNDTSDGLTPDQASRLCSVLARFNSVLHKGPNSWPEDTFPRDTWRKRGFYSWVDSLQAGLYRVPYDEMGRTWFMLRTKWEITSQTTQGVRKPPIALPLQGSLEQHFSLAMVALQRQGWIENPEQVFAKTLKSDQWQGLVASLPSANSVVGSWAEIQAELENEIHFRFGEEPLIRLPDNSIMAPDPWRLFAAIGDRVTALARAEVRASVFGGAAGMAFGTAFESQVEALVADCAAHSSDRFMAKFKYSVGGVSGLESPDAFLVSDDLLFIFECKSTMPKRQCHDYADFIDLLSKAAGGNKDRKPYDQLMRFLRAWEDPSYVSPGILGAKSQYANIKYVVVVPFEVPTIVYDKRWRKTVWPHRHRAIDRNTLFLSISDLGTANTILRMQHRAGRPTNLMHLLTAWLRSWRKPLLFRNGLETPSGLGLFLREHWDYDPSASFWFPFAEEAQAVVLRDLFSADAILKATQV